MSELSMYLIVIIRYIMAGSYGTLFILHVNWHLTNNTCTPPFFSYIPSAYSQKNLQHYHNQKEKQIHHQLIHQPAQSSLFYSIFDQLYFPFTHLNLSWFWVFVIKKIFSMYVNVYSGILSIVNFIAYTLSITCLYFSTVSLIGASCTARLFFNCGCLESSFFLSDFRCITLFWFCSCILLSSLIIVVFMIFCRLTLPQHFEICPILWQSRTENICHSNSLNKDEKATISSSTPLNDGRVWFEYIHVCYLTQTSLPHIRETCYIWREF